MDDYILFIIMVIAYSIFPAMGVLIILALFDLISGVLFAAAMFSLPIIAVVDVALWHLLGYEEKSAKPPVSIYGNLIERNSDTIESKKVNGKARGQTIEKTSHTIEKGIEPSFQSIEKTIEKPSKDNLAKLKEALNIKYGFLEYKASGDKVYHVFYVPELKHQKWKIIGTWTELKAHLKRNLPSVVTTLS